MNFIGTTVSTGSLGWLELSGPHGYAVGLRFFRGEAGNSLARSMVSALRVAAVQPCPWVPCMKG